MNTRQAGEDFYFLERLAKTGQVDRIMTARVYPSARRSWRVPFGTGRALAQPESLETVYAPESYDILGRWLSTLETASDMSADWLRTEAAEIEVTLGEFLEFDGFYDDWTRICEQAKSESQYQRRAHDRFGAWTTLKLLHHLRDTRFPDAPIWSAVETLLEHLDAADGFSEPDSRSSATNVLETLRNLDRR